MIKKYIPTIVLGALAVLLSAAAIGIGAIIPSEKTVENTRSQLRDIEQQADELDAKLAELTRETEENTVSLEAMRKNKALVDEDPEHYKELSEAKSAALALLENVPDDCGYSGYTVPLNYDRGNLKYVQGGTNAFSTLSKLGNPLLSLLGNGVVNNTQDDVSQMVSVIGALNDEVNSAIEEAELATAEYYALSELKAQLSPADTTGEAIAAQSELICTLYEASDVEALRSRATEKLNVAVATLDSYIPVYEMYLTDSEENEDYIALLHSARNNLDSILQRLGGSVNDIPQETGAALQRNAISRMSAIAALYRKGTWKDIRTRERKISVDGNFRAITVTMKGDVCLFAYDEPVNGAGAIASGDTGFYVYDKSGRPCIFNGPAGCIVFDSDGFAIFSDYSESEADSIYSFATALGRDGIKLSKADYRAYQTLY